MKKILNWNQSYKHLRYLHAQVVIYILSLHFQKWNLCDHKFSSAKAVQRTQTSTDTLLRSFQSQQSGKIRKKDQKRSVASFH